MKKYIFILTVVLSSNSFAADKFEFQKNFISEIKSESSRCESISDIEFRSYNLIGFEGNSAKDCTQKLTESLKEKIKNIRDKKNTSAFYEDAKKIYLSWVPYGEFLSIRKSKSAQDSSMQKSDFYRTIASLELDYD